MNEKVYNSINSSEPMAEQVKGKTIILKDEDVRRLLQTKKINIREGKSSEEIIIIHLQGNLIQKRDITSIGKEGYYHIPVSTMGEEFSTAFVIPADEKTEAR